MKKIVTVKPDYIQPVSVETGFTARILSVMLGTKRCSGFTMHLIFRLHHRMHAALIRIGILSLISLYNL